MKKVIIITTFLFITAFAGFGQTARQHIGLSVGASIPLKGFSKMILADSTSGFAKTGTGINVVYAFRAGHNLGFQLNVSFNSNKLDIQKLALEGEEANPGTSFSVESRNPWTSGGILFGPYLRFPITYSLSFDVKGLIGIYGAYSPQFTIRGTKDNGDKLEYYRYAAKTYNLGFNLGAGFKYRINDYYILLFGDYAGAKATFDHVTGIGWDNKSYDIPVVQNINSLRITIGFAYIL